MNLDPRISGRRVQRTGFVSAGTHEDAKRRYDSFPKTFKYTIIIIGIAAVYLLIDMALNSHALLSSRDYENVDSILLDDSDVNNGEELFDLLKKTWTKIPSAGVMVSEAEEFIQHKITVKYADGAQDEIYLYYNPYMEDNNGYAIRNMKNEKGEELVLSYSGYDKLMEFIEKSFG